MYVKGIMVLFMGLYTIVFVDGPRKSTIDVVIAGL
jgi:hypothetical protein